MTKNVYLVTDLSPPDLRRRANARGEVVMSARAAKYELMRGTLRLPVSESGPLPPTPVLADGGD